MARETTYEDIEAGALAARVSMTDVLRRAGVSRGTFYRWKRGQGRMLPLTKARLLDAIAELRLESKK